jgi:hypothetical protein
VIGDKVFSGIFVRFAASFTGTLLHEEQRNGKAKLWLLRFSTVAAALASFGCATQHATLNITTPSTAVAGSPFTITVTATVGGNRDTIINSAIKFTSSDPAAVLPALYYFNVNDGGSHTFTDGVTLMTPGSQSITATVIGAAGLNGSANVTVTAATTASQSMTKIPGLLARGCATSRWFTHQRAAAVEAALIFARSRRGLNSESNQ